LDVGSIDNSEFSSREPFRGDEVQHFKSLVCRGLIILVVRYQGTTEVRR
jgi:hypothetical protein